MRRYMKRFMFLGMSCLSLTCSFGFSLPQIHNFSGEQRFRLNSVFLELLLYDGVGDVLFGNVPLCQVRFGGFDNDSSNNNQEKETLLRNSLNELKQFVSENKKFKVDYCYVKNSTGPVNSYHKLTFINKRALKKSIRSHLAIFQEKLGKEYNISEIYRKIASQIDCELIEEPTLSTILRGWGLDAMHINEQGEAFMNEVKANVNLDYIDQITDSAQVSQAYIQECKNYAESHKDKWESYLTDLKSCGEDLIPGGDIPFGRTQEDKKIDVEQAKTQLRLKKELKNKSYLEIAFKKLK